MFYLESLHATFPRASMGVLIFVALRAVIEVDQGRSLKFPHLTPFVRNHNFTDKIIPPGTISPVLSM